MGSQYKHLYSSTPIYITMTQTNIQIITLYWRRPKYKGLIVGEIPHPFLFLNGV